MEKQTDSIQIHTRVTHEKITLVEHEYLTACMQNAHGMYAFRMAALKKSNQYVQYVMLKCFIAVASLWLIYSVLSDWISPNNVCRVNYWLDSILLTIAVFGLLKVTIGNYIGQKLMKKWVPYTSHKITHQIFKNLKAESLPLMAHYHIDSQFMTYTRIVNDSEKFLWKHSLSDCFYFKTENTVLIYKKKMFQPAYLIFVDESNIISLVHYLESIGVTRLPLPPLMPNA